MMGNKIIEAGSVEQRIQKVTSRDSISLDCLKNFQFILKKQNSNRCKLRWKIVIKNIDNQTFIGPHLAQWTMKQISNLGNLLVKENVKLSKAQISLVKNNTGLFNIGLSSSVDKHNTHFWGLCLTNEASSNLVMKANSGIEDKPVMEETLEVIMDMQHRVAKSPYRENGLSSIHNLQFHQRIRGQILCRLRR